MNEEQRTKNCKFCGKSLPEEAIFCYYCHRELLTRPERPSSEPQSTPVNWVIVGVIGVVVIAVVVLLLVF